MGELDIYHIAGLGLVTETEMAGHEIDEFTTLQIL